MITKGKYQGVRGHEFLPLSVGGTDMALRQVIPMRRGPPKAFRYDAKTVDGMFIRLRPYFSKYKHDQFDSL